MSASFVYPITESNPLADIVKELYTRGQEKILAGWCGRALQVEGLPEDFDANYGTLVFFHNVRVESLEDND